MKNEKFESVSLIQLIAKHQGMNFLEQHEIRNEIQARLDEDDINEYMRGIAYTFLKNPHKGYEHLMFMHPLNIFFDHIFCLTLDRRTDRRELADELFKIRGINVEFIYGIDGKEIDYSRVVVSSDGALVSNGDIGCTRSHLKMLELAKERNYRSVLIFEDDVQFKDEFKNLDNYLQNVPADWQMLYLGGDDVIVDHAVNNYFRRSLGVNTTHAYAIKREAYDSAIDALGKYEKVDLTLRTIHNKIPVYICSPKLSFCQPLGL